MPQLLLLPTFASICWAGALEVFEVSPVSLGDGLEKFNLNQQTPPRAHTVGEFLTIQRMILQEILQTSNEADLARRGAMRHPRGSGA